MQISELLRKLADVIDSTEGTEVQQAPIQQSSAPLATELSPAVNVDNTDTETMVPPLQQKHELLKKATEVENNVAAFADDNDDADLAAMLKIAGFGETQQSPNVASQIQPISVNPKMNAALAHHHSDNYDAE